MKAFNKFCSLGLVVLMLFTLLSVNAFALNDDTVAVLRRADGSEVEYPSINTALSRASNGATVYLVKPASLTASTSVKSGVTLVIPTSNDLVDANELKEGNGNVPGGITTPTVFVTLTVPENVTLTVDGTLIVAGNQQSTQPFSGMLSGPHGAVDLSGEIVVNGSLYARGEISGTGSITANSGSSVYQRFQIYDWRGGTQTLESVGLQVFPFSLFDIGGISVKTTYVNGARLYAQAYIYAGGEGRTQNIPYLGTNDGLVRFDQAAGDGVVFEKNGDNTTITAKTAVSTASLSIDVQTTDIFGNETTTTISTEKLICPFGFRMNLVVDNGASLSVFNRYKLVPGFKLTVNEGGTLNINSGAEMYFYAAGGYKEDYSFDPRNELEWDYSAAAVLESSGEINLNGDLATTSQDMTNLPAGQFQLVTGGLPTYVGEYIQGTYVGHVELVRFYKVTPITAA